VKLTLLNAAVGGLGNLDNGCPLILTHADTAQTTRAFQQAGMLADWLVGSMDDETCNRKYLQSGRSIEVGQDCHCRVFVRNKMLNMQQEKTSKYVPCVLFI
jgi:hypothetical protein